MAVLACAVLAATAPTAIESFRWVERGHALDPDNEVRLGRTLGMMHCVALSLNDADAALQGLADLIALPGGVDPEVALGCKMFRSQITFELGNVAEADRILASILDDRSSILWYGPITSLVVLRAVNGDIAGAEDALSHVMQYEESGTRITRFAIAAIAVHLCVARGDIDAAGSALRRFEAIYDDRRFTVNDAADHYWCNAAAHLAALVGDIDAAAVLVAGATATRRLETHPFITGTLRKRYEHEPAWQAAMARTPTSEDAFAAARRLARVS
jgi:hypothetical protein